MRCPCYGGEQSRAAIRRACYGKAWWALSTCVAARHEKPSLDFEQRTRGLLELEGHTCSVADMRQPPPISSGVRHYELGSTSTGGLQRRFCGNLSVAKGDRLKRVGGGTCERRGSVMGLAQAR